MLSRTASMLYWMARYVERAENNARILDVAYRMSLLTKDQAQQNQEWFVPLNITGTVFPFKGRHSLVCAREVLHFMALDPDNPCSIYNCARQARENARAVRGTITSEMWEVLNATWLELQSMDEERMYTRGVSAFLEWVKERSYLFRGVTVATVRRDEAFQFHRLGTYMERADNTARIIDAKYHILLPSVQDVGGAVDYYQWSALLRSVSAYESFRKVYRDSITPLRVAELLILRVDIPRSLHFCLSDVYQILRSIQNSYSSEATRQSGEIHAALQFGRVQDIFAKGLHEYLTEFLSAMGRLSSEINAAFFDSGSRLMGQEQSSASNALPSLGA